MHEFKRVRAQSLARVHEERAARPHRVPHANQEFLRPLHRYRVHDRVRPSQRLVRVRRRRDVRRELERAQMARIRARVVYPARDVLAEFHARAHARDRRHAGVALCRRVDRRDASM